MKMMHGFLLPSVLVYIAIVVLLAAAAVRLATIIIPTAYRLMSWCSITDFYNAHDLIYKELSCGPIDSSAWYQADNEGIIWSTGDQRAKGFIIVRGNLFYKEGIYNPTTQQWSGGTTSLIVRNCEFKNVYLHVKKGVMCHAQHTGPTKDQWWCYVTFPCA